MRVSEIATTPFSNQCNILGEFWIEYRDDADFAEFFDYNDVGLPMAYMISEGLVTATSISERFVGETWMLFLEQLNKEDSGIYETLDDLF